MTEESQQSIECQAAIRAALEKVGEYCGLGDIGAGDRHTIKFAGVIIEYPEEIHEIVIDEALTDEDRIERIATSEWAIGHAKELVSDLETSETPLAENVSVDMVAASIAEKIVEQTRTEEET